MVALLKRAPSRVERSPERAALVSAIEIATAADAAAHQHRAAVERARAAVETAKAKLEDATVRAGQAREAQTDALVLAATNGVAAPEPAALRQARIDTVAAQDDVDLAAAALARLEAELTEIEDAARHARKALHAAANAVLKTECQPRVAALLAEVRELADRLADRHEELGVFYSAGLIGDEGRYKEVRSIVCNPMTVGRVVRGWFGFTAWRGEPDWSRPDTPPALRAAFEALCSDADAALPEVA